MGFETNTGTEQQLGQAYSKNLGMYMRSQNTFEKYKKIGSPIMQGVGAALAPFTFGLSSLILGVADTATQAGLAAKNKKLLSKVNDVGFWKSNHVNQVDNSAVDPSGAINGVGTFMSTNMKSAEGKVDAAVKSNQGITQDVNAAPQTFDPSTSNPSQNFGSSVGSRTQSQGTWPAPTGPAASFGNGANTTLYGYAKGGGVYSKGGGVMTDEQKREKGMHDDYIQSRINKLAGTNRLYTGYGQPDQRRILSLQGVKSPMEQDYYMNPYLGDGSKGMGSDTRGYFAGEPKRISFRDNSEDGNFQYKAEGGGITPNIGTTKSDSIDTYLAEGGFVIPAEYVDSFKSQYGKFFPELYQTANV